MNAHSLNHLRWLAAALCLTAAAARGARYTWSLAGNGNWNVSANWNPATGFPVTTGDVASFAESSRTISLNQATVTVGVLNMTPQNFTAGYTVDANAAGQTLVFDNGASPAEANILSNRWAGGTISAAVQLSGELRVTTTTQNDGYALTFRGPITGVGPLAFSGRVGLNPLVDTIYAVPFSSGVSGYLWKRGSATATLVGTHAFSLAGDWGDGRETVGGGGRLVVAGIVTNLNNQTRTLLFADSGNALVVTNGGQLVTANNTSSSFFRSDNRVIVTGAGSLFAAPGLLPSSQRGLVAILDGGRLELKHADLSVTGSTNTVYVGSAGTPSILDLKGRKLVLGENDTARGNRLVVDAGGIVTNGQIRTGEDNNWSIHHTIIVTNGGRVFANGGAGDFAQYHKNVISNTTVVTGPGSTWNSLGQAFTIARVTGSGNVRGLANLARVERGGVLTNCSVTIGTTPGFSSGPTAADNALVITNGGLVFCNANSVVGNGDTWSANTAASIRNLAVVAGGPAGSSRWNLGGKDLTVGYARWSGAVVQSNALVVASGGIVTNVAALKIGSAITGCTGNRVVPAGGAVRAASLTLSAGNLLAPLLGADGLQPVVVSGSATLAAGSIISPSATPDAPDGTYTVLTAGTLAATGLALDPAVDPAEWSFAVDTASSPRKVTVTFKRRGPAGTRIIIR